MHPSHSSFALVLFAVSAVAAPSTATAEGPNSHGSEPPSGEEHSPEQTSRDGLYAGGGAGRGTTGEPESPPTTELLNRGTAELHRCADSSPRDVLDQLGIEPPETCSPLATREALERRGERWKQAVRLLGRTHPAFVFGWLTGTHRPPKRVLDEVRAMRNCMLDALFREAARPEAELTVELEIGSREIRGPYRARKWARSYFGGERRRERMRRAVTKSHYRPAAEQADIWQRKVRFLGPAFDRITARAAARCGLDAGDSWNPDLRRHGRCWRHELSAHERGREILSASAAPGLSRHHWGTEIDLFALTRSAFRPDRERHNEYRWMRSHAGQWGFFQAYGSDAEAYLEERWHWSYDPIASALTAFARRHRDELEARLDGLWKRIERRHNREYPTDLSFDFAREHWERYLFGFSAPARR